MDLLVATLLAPLQLLRGVVGPVLHLLAGHPPLLAVLLATALTAAIMSTRTRNGA